MQGPTEGRIIAQAIKSKMPLPDAIANAPELGEGLDQLYLAFLELSTCRYPGYGCVRPIPWTALNDYAKRYQFDEESFDYFAYIILAMDEVYVNHHNTLLDEARKANGKSA